MSDDDSSLQATASNGIADPDEQKSDGTSEDKRTESTAPAVEPESEAADVEKTDGRRRGREISVSVRGLLLGALVIALVVAVGVLAWRVNEGSRELDAREQQTQNVARAESIALDYATNAAAMNFEDLEGWKVKLVAGTSPELADRLNEAAEQMKQILVPLQWNSTARPLAAKVRSESGGVYDVDAFVSVLTKTAQGPDPLQSTATYRVTVDSNKNWQITDVGGIGAAVGER